MPPVPILNQINPSHTPILIFEDPFPYYFPVYAQFFQVSFFPQFSLPKHFMHPSCLSHVPHEIPISFLLSCSSEKRLVRSTDHKAPHFVVFSSLLLPRPSSKKDNTYHFQLIFVANKNVYFFIHFVKLVSEQYRC